MSRTRSEKKETTQPMSEIAKTIVRAAILTRDAAVAQCNHDCQLARDHDKVPKDWGSDGENWTAPDSDGAKT